MSTCLLGSFVACIAGQPRKQRPSLGEAGSGSNRMSANCRLSRMR